MIPKMKPILFSVILLGGGVLGQGQGSPVQIQELGEGLTVIQGVVNGARLSKNGKVLAVYGDPRESAEPVDTVLFTHHRRDVVWAGQALVERGARAIVPAHEVELFSRVETFWSKFREARFHDYAQKTTKVLREPVPVTHTAQEDEPILWEGLSIRVLETPGYTPGAVTYLVESGSQKIAFTGDLIYGDGQLFDLYSFQDAIAEAKIGGYHGYAGRLGQLMMSLYKIADEKPHLIVPARGPLLTDPLPAIEKLVKRIQALYANYLSIDALRWYFKDDHIRIKAKRVLGASEVSWMPMAENKALPDWIEAIDNSRLILSRDGSGFLVDCGSRHVLETMKQRHSAGKLKGIEGVYITHYHDDHTDQVPELVQVFGSTVYAWSGLADVLRKPSAYRLPCLSKASISLSGSVANQATWRWKEFEMTSFYFPGQTLYHGALLVKKDRGETIFFVGDSFTPSGIDDYCLQNRNFLHEAEGYFKCLALVEQAGKDCWLINQHVEPVFRFSPDQLRIMKDTLDKRLVLLQDLSPWDNPNYLLDEGWARFYPYALQAQSGETIKVALKILNHSPRAKTFRPKLNLPKNWVLDSIAPLSIKVPPRQEGSMEVTLKLPAEATQDVSVISADLQWENGEVREWTEAMVELIQPALPILEHSQSESH